MKEFTHFNKEGRAKMVDVSGKNVTKRTASASAKVLVNRETLQLIKSGGIKKGDVLNVAQTAGIMGAKKTSELIPMAHNIIINGVDIKFIIDEKECSITIVSEIKCNGKTGVEMEALTCVSLAALTIYDMCKAVQRDIEITDIHLKSKTGGSHGDYKRKAVN